MGATPDPTTASYVEVTCRACGGRGRIDSVRHYPSSFEVCDGCQGAGVHLFAIPQAETKAPRWIVTYEGGCGGPTGGVCATYDTYEDACGYLRDVNERFKGHGIRPQYSIRAV